jgi:hypothetical protein
MRGWHSASELRIGRGERVVASGVGNDTGAFSRWAYFLGLRPRAASGRAEETTGAIGDGLSTRAPVGSSGRQMLRLSRRCFLVGTVAVRSSAARQMPDTRSPGVLLIMLSAAGFFQEVGGRHDAAAAVGSCCLFGISGARRKRKEKQDAAGVD